MADDLVLNPGVGGATVAADNPTTLNGGASSNIYVQRVKVMHGPDGTATDVSTASPLPVTLANTGANATAVKVDGSAVTQPVSAASLPLPTGAATAAKQPALGTAGTASADVITIQGIASMTKLLVTPDSVALPANQSVNVAQLAGTATDVNSGNKSAGTLRVVLATDQPALTNKILVTPDLPSGASTAAKQPALGTAGTASADVITVQGIASMTALKVDGSAVTQPVSMATNTPVGNVAHDGVDSGAPIKMGGRADTTFQTAVSDGDRVDWLFDVYGVATVRDDHPNKWSYHENSSSALTDTSVQAAPGAGLSIYITDIILSCGGATAMSLIIEEGTTTTVVGPLYLEAIAGRTVHIKFRTPKKAAANTAITVTTTGAVAHGLDILGFIAP
jgi:hypothetical protein